MSTVLLAAQVLAVFTATVDTRVVHVDPDGHLWAGTTGGLVSGDGPERRVYTPADGLPDGTVRALLREGDTLWVGTDRGVARCTTHHGELRVVEVYAPNQRVEALVRHDGQLWVGTTSGLFVLQGQVLRAIPEVTRVTALASLGGALYVASPGLGVFQHQGDRRRRLRGDRLAWDLAVDGDRLWVATSRGLELYRGWRRMPSVAVRASRRIPGRDLRCVRVHEGSLVVGSRGGGVWRLDGRRFVPVEGIDRRARVQALGVRGGRWIAGTPAGLVGAGAGQVVTSLPDNDLSALARTAEGLWVGTFDRGLALVRDDGSVEVFDEASGLIDDRVNRFAVDGEGDLWVATDRGVVERQGSAFVLRGLLDRHVFALGVIDGVVHAGAGAEVFAYRQGRFQRVAQPGRRPQDFACAGAGEAWIASAEGLAHHTDDGWALLGTDDGLSDDWATAVAVDPSGVGYVGTYASGVARLSEGGVELLREDLWVNAAAMEWLPEVGGEGVLAVGSLDDGLWLYRARDESWEHVGTGEGLPDDDVTAVVHGEHGVLWVATRGGLARVALR